MGNAFKDRSFQSRFTAMGDEAEAVFEQVATTGFARYGLSRPPVSLGKVPAMVRYTPDYLQHNRLVEVQGIGRDRTIKLKVDKHAALLQWHTIFPTFLFIWDNVDEVYGEIQITDFPTHLATLDSFEEGKAYFALHHTLLGAEWAGLHDAF